jgi:hypothetical protein
MVRLLGGLMLWVTTTYCGPRVRTGQERGREGTGLYPELGALGFCKGASPALVSTVARQSMLMPSFELAHQEMARRGVNLNLKTVRRLSERLGTECLVTRTRDLMAWRAGQVTAGSELAGKRVGVAIDGGRTRLRENRRPQRRKGKRRTRRRRYDPKWREPKLLIIFELDDHGRMKRGTRAWIDGTFEGPDHMMELLAFHLHRLGAAQARNVAFISDGAPWIWDRLDWVKQKVGLVKDKTERILDWCHAVHHVSLALEQLKLSDTVRRRIFHRLRQNLRAGRAQCVIGELKERAAGKRHDHEVWREIAYLEKHTAHMDYKRLRKSGLPLGSGAIESAIRRVVNQRLKGNGIMWLKENAEAMLVLRAAALTGRWEELLQHVHTTMATNRRLDWHWTAPDMPAELQGPEQLKPPNPSCAVALFEKKFHTGRPAFRAS